MASLAASLCSRVSTATTIGACSTRSTDRAAGSGALPCRLLRRPRKISRRMHERGIRGVRCNLINPGGLSPAAVTAWQPALRAMGWHVEFHLAVDQFEGWAEVVQSFDIPVVVDHMGRPTPGHGDPESPALTQLIRFVRAGRCLVKLSAPYRLRQRVRAPVDRCGRRWRARSSMRTSRHVCGVPTGRTSIRRARWTP